MTCRALLVFDLDGTLFRTQTVTVPAVQRAFRKYGLKAPARNIICPFFGRPGTEFHAWIRNITPPDLSDDIIAAIDTWEIRNIRRAGRLYPSIRRTLKRFHAGGFQLALCTNGPESYVTAVLEQFSLNPFFTLIRCRTDESDTKPSMLREILDLLKTRPAAMTGDRNDDIEAAQAAGIISIAAAYGYGNALELRHADAVVADPKCLYATINEIVS